MVMEVRTVAVIGAGTMGAESLKYVLKVDGTQEF